MAAGSMAPMSTSTRVEISKPIPRTPHLHRKDDHVDGDKRQRDDLVIVTREERAAMILHHAFELRIVDYLTRAALHIRALLGHASPFHRPVERRRILENDKLVGRLREHVEPLIGHHAEVLQAHAELAGM